jgi:putative ABC transport system permease protein
MRGGEGRPRRVGWRASRRELRQDVESEIAFHLEARIAELEAQGYTRSEARTEALRRFGDIGQTSAVCVAADVRRLRRRSLLENVGELRDDARLGLRQLARRPGFTAVAVITLGLGIGANVAMFAAVDHVLLRPLPLHEPERVVTLWETDERTGERKKEASPGNFIDLRERTRSFSAIALAQPYAFDVLGDGPPESVPAWLVSEGWFEALGARPLLGRTFDAADYASAAPTVALISEGFWQRRYGGDRAVVGRTIRLDEGSARIVGVLPHAQSYPDARDLWVPKVLQPHEANDRRSAFMPVVARLAEGVSPGAAQQEADRVAAELARSYPQTNAATGFNVVPLQDHLLGPVRPALAVLFGAVAFLLLIACTNLASLLLARGSARQQELSVRAALGAGRGRLVRQLVAENAVLTTLGGAAGFALALIGTRALVAQAPPGMPRMESLGMDGRVVAFLIVTTMVAGGIFSAIPAIRFSRPDVMRALRGRSGVHRERHGLRSALVGTQIALALMLLVAAGLLAHSFLRLTSNDVGFDTGRSSYIQAFLWDRNPTVEERVERVRQMQAALQQAAGVERVGAVSALPFHPHAVAAQGALRFDDRPVRPGDEAPRVFATVASPGYFDVMRIPVVAGRVFDDRDRDGAPPVAVVNEALVRTYYGAENPIGRRITIGVMGAPAAREIVGVVRDVRPTALDANARPELFVPHAQHGTGSMTFVVRGVRGEPPLADLQQALWRVDPQQTIYSSGTMRSLIAVTLAERRFQLIVGGLISVLAFALATIGMYGLISFLARQRIHEIGVRMALGARGGEVILLIVRQSLRLALAGVIAGLLGAAAFSRLLRGLLYDTSPLEPLVYAQLALLVLGMAALAAWLPARRTLREDPLRALRSE